MPNVWKCWACKNILFLFVIDRKLSVFFIGVPGEGQRYSFDHSMCATWLKQINTTNHLLSGQRSLWLASCYEKMAHGKKYPKKLKKKKKTIIKKYKNKNKNKMCRGGGGFFSIFSVWSLKHCHSWNTLPCIHQQYSIIATCYRPLATNHLLLLPHLIISREEDPSINSLGPPPPPP